MTKDNTVTSVDTDESQPDVPAENQPPHSIAPPHALLTAPESSQETLHSNQPPHSIVPPDVPLIAPEFAQEQNHPDQSSNVESLQNAPNVASTTENSESVEGSSMKVKDAGNSCKQDRDICTNESVDESYLAPLSDEVKIQVEQPQEFQPEPCSSQDLTHSDSSVKLYQKYHEDYYKTGEICPAPLLADPPVYSHLPQISVESKGSSFDDLEQQESLSLEIKLNSDEDHSENIISDEDAIRICPASVSPVVHVPNQETVNKELPCVIFLERRYRIFIKQLDTLPVIYGAMLVVLITLAATKLHEPHDVNYDIYCSVFIVTIYCGVFSLLFEPGMCNEWANNVFQDECVCICCPCEKSYNFSAFYKHSQHFTKEETDINFVHEVADTSNINSLHSPRPVDRHEESLDSSSSKFLPESPMAIDVEVHGIKTPSYSSEGKHPLSSPEGACGGQSPAFCDGASEDQSSSSRMGACGDQSSSARVETGHSFRYSCEKASVEQSRPFRQRSSEGQSRSSCEEIFVEQSRSSHEGASEGQSRSAGEQDFV